MRINQRLSTYVLSNLKHSKDVAGSSQPKKYTTEPYIHIAVSEIIATVTTAHSQIPCGL